MAEEKRTIGMGMTELPLTEFDRESFRRYFDAIERLGVYGAAVQRKVADVTVVIEHFGTGPYLLDSPPSFASRILMADRKVQEAISEGDANGAAAWALYLGETYATGAMKNAWEAAALRGVKILASAQRGHEAVHGTASEKDSRWSAIAQDYRSELARGTSAMAAREVVADRHGVSGKTVYRAAKRNR